MHKNVILIALILVFAGLTIGIPFLFNNWIPLNFSCYFVLCAICIILCLVFLYGVKRKSINKRTILIIPWLITTIASFLVTINYISPKNSKVYSNADANILALKGVDAKDSLVLVGNNKLSSLFDSPEYEGRIIIKPSDSLSCKVVYDVLDQPLYLSSDKLEKDALLNSNLLPSFSHSLVIKDSLTCTISFSEIKETKWFSLKKDFPFINIREQVDSMLVSVSFDSESGKNVYTSAFHKRIKDSYNLYDVVHKNVSFTPQEEELIDRLRNITIIRNKEYTDENGNSKKKKFFITYNHFLKTTSVLCDDIEYEPPHSQCEYLLSSDDYIYLGQYTTNTRSLSFKVNESGYIEGRYRFPYLYNFPRSSIEDDFHDGQRKILAISSSIDRLLQSDVEEAFYCDLFYNENNSYGFSGTINYKVSSCDVPFDPSIIDDQKRDNKEDNTLLAKNGSIWHLKIYDLRKCSPITGESVPYVNSSFILLIIAICCLFAFLSTQLYYKNSYKAGTILAIWLFLIPIFVFRLYLLWRIAVFPPVSDITFNVFQRYRLENAWLDNAMVNTLIALLGVMIFTILSIRLENKNILSCTWGSKYVYKSFTRYIVLYCSLWGFTFLMGMASSRVFTNIFAPVVCFAICEYISLKGLNYKWRSANALFATVLLFVSDPGYAIMFVIFVCIYFIIHVYAYLKSSSIVTSNKAFAFLIWLVLFITLGVTIIFSPQLVAFASNNTTEILVPFLTPSKILFAVIATLIGVFLFLFFWIKAQKKLAFISLMLIPLYALVLFNFGNAILEHERHFKYRSLVHTEPVSEIMSREDIDDVNSTRVLEASQNQWFIQYHNNRGAKRIVDDGIFSLSPHFKMGVTWNTQISDVIISRYVVGEISSVLPAAIVLLALCFLVFMFCVRNISVAGRSLGYAVALLIVIQMTFVWMAATNRMIFFGQDFPFLSQNARITMILFVVLIGFVMLTSNLEYRETEAASNIEPGLKIFSTKKIPLFVTVFLLIFVYIGLFGNKYSSLYNQGDGGDSNNASEYNLSRMMTRCQADLSLINAYLASSNIKVRSKLIDGESLSTLMDSLDNEYGEGCLTHNVTELYENKEISKFTLSMYNAFRNNLKRRNSISNIIHLKLNSSRTHYEFALNNGFYSLKNPNFNAMAWKNHVYSDNVRISPNNSHRIEKNGYIIYGVPTSWLPKGCEIGVVDATNVNKKTINQKRTLHSELADYQVDLPIYPIKAGDVLEVSSMERRTTESYRYGLSQKDILVKNMVINGKRKYFYPLKEKCFWLKDFSDLASFCYTNNEDSLVITLDKDLTINIYNALAETGKVCSVVTMDGHGNVRVMADFKGSKYMLDPNDEEGIYERVKYSYLNPNPKEDMNFFGNMNLCLLSPGPGSSLKPITYAAVTSQALVFPWEKLKLMNPSPEFYDYNDYIQKKYERKKMRTYLYKYGPSYKYRKPFQSIYSDEDGELGYGEQKWVDNVFYLAQSSNYYNALITYMGHYGSIDENEFISKILHPATISDYPKISFDNGNSVYAFRITPQEENSRNNLLLNGLWSNFSIPTYLSYNDTLRYCFAGNKFSEVRNVTKDTLVSIFPWVYPQNSRIFDYLLEELTPAERLRQYTLGSYPLAVTPIKMAEMYGKLFSLHPDFHATIIPNSKQFTEKWRGQDGDIVSQNNVLAFYQKNLFAGMHECVKQGTAKEYLKDSSENLIENLSKDYSYYAKTGTLLGTGAELDDRMLAVIITNKPIESVSRPSELRFYVVYFRFKQSGDMKNIKKVLNLITSSKSFKSYMR